MNDPKTVHADKGNGKDRVLTTSMRWNYGVIEIEYSVSYHADPATQLRQNQEFLTQTLRCEAAHKQFASEVLPKLRNMNPDVKDAERSEKRKQVPRGEYTVRRIYKEVKDGKTYYRLQTTSGMFMKYGAQIWKEIQDLYGIPDLLGGKDELILLGGNVTTTIEERKGGAVVSIRGLP